MNAMRGAAAVLCVAVLLTGCVQRGGIRDAPLTVGPRYAVMRVHYGTDRAIERTDGVRTFYSDRRVPNTPLSFGHCDVSIPPNHEVAELEGPAWWENEDPEEHIVLLGNRTISREQLVTALRRHIDRRDGPTVLVFVHGYNVGFEDAARRTAQIAYDLNFDGPALFYSWPSRASTIRYTEDNETIRWSAKPLREFLEVVATSSPDARLAIISHSMGNQGVSDAIVNLVRDRPEVAARISRLVLAAPDVDAEIFRRDIAPAMARLPAPVTLYQSSADKAMVASRGVNGLQRLGDARGGMRLFERVESIDASDVRVDFVEHGYVAEAPELIVDLRALINEGRDAAGRALERRDGPAGASWRLRPR